MRSAILVVALLVTLGCVERPTTEQSTPDPNSIKLIGFSEIVLSNGERMSVLNYQTDLPIDNVEKLTQEADRIWPYFKPQADASGVSSAMIKAHARPVGFIVTSSKSQSFVYLKDKKGSWARAKKG